MEKIKEPVDKKKDVAYYTDYREFGGVPNDGSSGSISANKQMNTMSLREKIMRGNDGALNKKLREETQRKKIIIIMTMMMIIITTPVVKSKRKICKKRERERIKK